MLTYCVEKINNFFSVSLFIDGEYFGSVTIRDLESTRFYLCILILNGSTVGFYDYDERECTTLDSFQHEDFQIVRN